MTRVAIGSWFFAVALGAHGADPSVAAESAAATSARVAGAPSVGIDVRLVVDVSGSMKSGDPEFLRQDVLNDLVEALPENSRGGVWTFGSTANNVVPHGALDERWRRAARAARSAIVSAAPLTNLRDALASAAWDVDAPAPGWDRHILLVTDGRIDVGRDGTQNDAQRRAIVEQWLPRLRANGIRLDSIALSNDADVDFLAQLADATDGRAGRADTVMTVKHFIVRAYGTATPRMGAFVVAERVAELTVFSEGADPLSLQSPRGDTIDATHTSGDIRWHAAHDGTWVTLSNPAPGRWRVTPDSPSVRTFSSLELSAHPNESAEAPTLRVEMLDGGRPLDAALRDALSLDAELTTRYGIETLRITPVADAAAFDVALGSPLTADDEVALHLAGPTFERKRVYVETITHPIDVDVSDEGSGTAGANVRVNVATVDPTTLRVLATTSVAGGARATLGVGARQADGAWRIVVPALGRDVDVRFKILFKDADGRDVEIDPESIALTLPVTKPHRYGFDENGRAIVDPVRPPPIETPPSSAAAPIEAAAEAPAAPASDAEPDAPTTRAPHVWEWIAMLVIALASVASLGWLFTRRDRADEADGGFDVALASYRDALTAAAKPQAATTT
jgi:hypothetical protein